MAKEEKEEGPATAIVSALSAGLPSTVKGRVQKAILRLIVGSIKLDYIEQVRENVSTLEGRNRIDAMVADEIGRQALADPAFMARAKARFLGEMARKQENIEAIAVIAQAKVDAAPDADTVATDPASEPSQDWMNAFTREAEGATSEALRERLAAVLAGEARKPGSFSRSTVRLIAELEQEILQGFQQVLIDRAGDAIVRDETWNKGVMFEIGVMLEDAGLISGAAGFTHRVVHIGDNRTGIFLGEKASLVITGEPGAEKEMPIWPLTRVGKQVASLLPETDERAALRKVATAIDKTQLERITMGPNLPAPPGQFSVSQQEILWPPRPPGQFFNLGLDGFGNDSSISKK